jgi:phosphomannomutase
MMKKQHALIGGEGNGGVIIPQLHYGRDALAGIALFLTHVAEQNIPLTELKKSYPAYQMIKDKIQLTPEVDVQQIILRLKDAFKSEILNETDGLKIDFEEGWVHLRSSNTEPIIRIYAEAADEHTAKSLIHSVKSKI